MRLKVSLFAPSRNERVSGTVRGATVGDLVLWQAWIEQFDRNEDEDCEWSWDAFHAWTKERPDLYEMVCA